MSKKNEVKSKGNVNRTVVRPAVSCGVVKRALEKVSQKYECCNRCAESKSLTR